MPAIKAPRCRSPDLPAGPDAASDGASRSASRPTPLRLLPLLLGLLTACGPRDTPPPASPAAIANMTSDGAVTSFLERHWQRPLAAQGPVPAQFSPLEAALDPESCGRCHVDQYRDWQTSLHARAMGPGLMGQLVDLAATARDEHQACIRCHAPLAEQAESLATEIAATAVAPAGMPAAGPVPLHRQGLVCAACHLRAHQRFGPPRRDGTAPDAGQLAKLPHNGFNASAAFSDSRFCAACHQFAPDEFALAGKLLENTYAEWQASRHAREGRSCQSCHMPDRRHLWRGIHDPEMVRRAVSFEIAGLSVDKRRVETRLTLRNHGAGHHFPTYVTPRVRVEIVQRDANGQDLPKSRVERVIQRQLPVDLGREIADTRLPSDGELQIDYRQARQARAVELVFRLHVEPDEFYARFYRSRLAEDAGTPGSALLRQALRQAEASPYVAIEAKRPLPR